MLDKDETKAVLKEALKEWLDSKWAAIGRWSLSMMLASGFVIIIWALLTINGWHTVSHNPLGLK